MSEPILVEREGAIATVLLNAPGKLNALSKASWRELGARMRELSADTELRCVVLRGAGNEAFAAGADIAEFPEVRANVERMHAERPEDTVVLLADKDSESGVMTKVMDQVRAGGILTVSVATKGQGE